VDHNGHQLTLCPILQAEVKANKAVEKAAAKEAKYQKGLTRAEEKHNGAVTKLNKAKQDLQVSDWLSLPPLASRLEGCPLSSAIPACASPIPPPDCLRALAD
jgi:hypothetical protein